MPLTAEEKAMRRKMIKKRSKSMRISSSQRARWAEKREHAREVARQAGVDPIEFDPDNAGSPDGELNDLPDTVLE